MGKKEKQAFCRIREDGGTLMIEGRPYSAPFVKALKTAVPGYDRRYVDETRTWVVRQGYADAVRRIAAQFYPDGVWDVREEDGHVTTYDLTGVAVLESQPVLFPAEGEENGETV